VFLHVRRRVNQLPDFFRLPLQDGGAFTLPVFTQQIVHRPGATVLQGKPEEVRELIDASPYVKKYTSGVLSFAEADLPPGQR
ncbi:hypothetical protein NGC22_23925, partial [Enterobacter hormaechei]|nr:hypothetical protein [Enterobacter hormaechei]